MTDHRAQALNNPNVYDANMHALVYLGDQVKRIADTLESQGSAAAVIGDLVSTLPGVDTKAAVERAQQRMRFDRR